MKEIKDLLDLGQAKLDGLVQNNISGEDIFEVGYSNAIKDMANWAGLDKDEYGIDEI